MADTQWLAQDEQRAWRTYVRGSATVADELNRDMESTSGLSLNEYEVLVHLSESEGWAMRMSTLADMVVHSRSRISHTINRLEKAGWVCRQACPNDRRGVNCLLTQSGYEKLSEAAPFHAAAVRRVLVDKLGHEQMLELGRLFSLIVSHKEG